MMGKRHIEKRSASEAVSPPVHPFPVVGVGASAGGLEACTELLKHLSPDTGMAFVFVQHLDPTHTSMLSTLLSRASPVPLHEAAEGMAIEPNHAYVIPPNTYLSIADGVLRLTPRPATRGVPMPIDYFFASLAEHRASQAIGVVLSGTGSDGTNGLAEIKARGGITFAQDEKTATYASMPRAAARDGAADFVLPPASIAHELKRIGRSPGALRGDPPADATGIVEGSADLSRVLFLMKQATGADLAYYKPGTLHRRLARRIFLLNVGTLSRYLDYVQEHPVELTALHNDILINVTGFFRDPEMLAGLTRHVFPALFRNRRPGAAIRVWVAGCSTGEEAYSIAMALLEFSAAANVTFPIQIFATDLSEPAIARCRTGVYGDDVEVSPERLARFFTKTEPGYQISKTIRDLCIFAKHNLIEDPPYSQVDLVSCRNVLIYLRPEYQRRVFALFHYALTTDGFLMLGRSETAGTAVELFASVDKEASLFAKKPTTARSPGQFVPRLERSSRASIPIATPHPATHLGDLLRKAEAVLARHSPAAVLIDDEAEILHFRGDTSPYLAPPAGSPTLNLFKMARDGLQLDLRVALDAARKDSVAVSRPVTEIHGGRRVTIEITPLVATGGGRHFIVLFNETDEGAAALVAAESSGAPSDEPAVARLRQELHATRAQLDEALQQLETLNEGYRCAHEESLSTNEELQSTNEELETAKEELQSSNEELTTVNDELQARSGELSQTNDDLTNVLTSVHVPMILVGTDLCLRRFTPMATKVLNVIASDVGRAIADITLNVIVPDLPAMIRESMDTMQPRERDVQDHDGRWYVMRVRPYRTNDQRVDGAVLMLIDIADLRRALEVAESARTYAEAIVETVRQPLLVLDGALRVQTANHAFYDTFEVTEEQTQGVLLFELGNGQWDIPDLKKLLREIIPERTHVEDFEVRHSFPSLGERSMVLNARRMEQAGSIRILLAIEDVTARRHATHEREELLLIADRARADADTANLAKDEFLALLAHELRNPLSAVRNGILTAQRDETRRERALDIAERQSEHLVRLVDDLLDVARITHGKILVRRDRVVLADVVHRAAETVRPFMDGRAQTLAIARTGTGAGVLDGDPARLEQIVENLLTNAAKYTPPGGHVDVSIHHQGHDVILRVRDNGAGIAPELLPRVFDLFAQGDSSLDRARGGLGIGLTVVRRLVELHGGQIEARSEGIDQGAEFTVRIPARTVDMESAASSGPMPMPMPMPLPSRSVLVVEDNADAAEALQMLLELFGHRVRVAHNGPLALEAVHADPPEIALVDIGLPGMDGYELVGHLRAQPGMEHATLVALSGYGRNEDKQRALAAGFHFHLTKPVAIDRLQALMGEFAVPRHP